LQKTGHVLEDFALITDALLRS